MKYKLILIALFIAIAFSSLTNAQLINQPCSSNQYCDGYAADNGQCFGACKPLEEDPCNSPWWNIWDQLKCGLFKSIKSGFGRLSQSISEGVGSLINPDVNPKGNEKLYQLSFSISFTLAVLLLLGTVILFFKEAFNETSNVEILTHYRTQIFKFFIMIALLFSSDYLISLFIETFNTLNNYIITSMVSGGNIVASLLATLGLGAAILIPLFFASMGTAMIGVVLLFMSFFIVLMMRGIILYVLLAFVPVMIVLYFFDFTQRAGERLFKLLFAHILISTIWITVFAVAFDFPNQFAVYNPARLFAYAFAPLAAIVINSMLYFKVMTFFGSYESAILSRGKTFGKIIERRKEIVKTVREWRTQKKLTQYTK